MDGYCEQCRFWMAAPTEAAPEQGECRRHAPLVTGGLHSEVTTEWPKTHCEDVCGDWEFGGDPRTPKYGVGA
jgi:hypothetical protein